MGLDVFGFANNKGLAQLAHPYSLISTFVPRLLKSITSRLATSEISISLLVRADLNFTLLVTPKTGFFSFWAQIVHTILPSRCDLGFCVFLSIFSSSEPIAQGELN